MNIYTLCCVNIRAIYRYIFHLAWLAKQKSRNWHLQNFRKVLKKVENFSKFELYKATIRTSKNLLTIWTYIKISSASNGCLIQFKVWRWRDWEVLQEFFFRIFPEIPSEVVRFLQEFLDSSRKSFRNVSRNSICDSSCSCAWVYSWGSFRSSFWKSFRIISEIPDFFRNFEKPPGIVSEILLIVLLERFY